MTTSNFEVAKYWSEREPKFVIDINEPACFACGYYESDYCIRNVVVVESGLFLTSGIHALLGRNVLEHCLFSYNGVLQTFSLTCGGQG